MEAQMSLTYDPLAVALEIREQLASEKRKLAFFLGAGTSMAVGIPGINELSDKVCEQLSEPFKTQYNTVKNKIPTSPNVEKILDRIRLIREMIGDSEKEEMDGLKGATTAKSIDTTICNTICEIISKTPGKGLNTHLDFAHWIRALHSHRDYPLEIFTTNYDVLLECAMEQIGLPYFDGFVGSVNPFFVPESVEAEKDKKYESVYPPQVWTRLWKIHGSINWCICKNTNGTGRITRVSNIEPKKGNELVIFPSREKYMQSRKLPFLAFQDRLRKFLRDGESLMIIAGYSFLDEHLNEIIFQGLRSNPRLAIMALIYGDESAGKKILPERIINYARDYKNITIYGPDKACIGGIVAPWTEPSRKRKENESWPFWDETLKQFKLGDFVSFVSFLETFIGFKPMIASSQLPPEEEGLKEIKTS